MISNNKKYMGHALRIAVGFLIMLLLMILPVNADVQDTHVIIRGQVFSFPEDSNQIPAWDASTFGGLFYDFKNNRKTEYLSISGQTLADLSMTRTIGEKNLTYQTGKAMVEFKVYEQEGLPVINNSEYYADTYPAVGWKGEKWIGIKGNANKLSRLVLEMDTEEMKTLATGETWGLGSGYELIINAIDAGTTPRQVWFSIKKDGVMIDDGISSEKNVYYKTQTIKGESDALLFAVYVESIFPGATSDMAQFRYVWLTDADSAIEIQSFDTYDKFKVKEASKDRIILENVGSVSLSRNTETNILGDIAFKTADSDNLRFYPYVKHTATGSYEMRGRVYSFPEDFAIPVIWDAQSFAGFFYDININRKTETLRIVNQNLSQLNNNRTIDDKNLIYQTGKEEVEFKVYEQEGLPVINNSEYYADTYPIVGWKGEKWVAINGNANKLSRLVLEMDTEDIKTLAIGETWVLGSGYELIINAVDTRATPRQVWFSLKKDGVIIDEGISIEKHVYYKTQIIKGEYDALLFAVYVESIFQDAVQFRYVWLTDANSAIEIQSSDTYDKFMVKEASKDRIILENNGSVDLSKNTDVKLLGDIYFKIADSDYLRFYPKMDFVIGESELPYSLSISINHGDVNTMSVLVNLSVFAFNATNMSFSNDGVSWSEWEPYATTKSWTLTGGEGLKTVYFKARNNAGEAAPVSNTINLDIIQVVKNVEIRGNVVNEPDTPALIPQWDASTFGGFYYDIKNNRKTEYLNISGQTLSQLNTSRSIGDKNLTYQTGKAMVEFKVHEKEGLPVISNSAYYADTYPVVGWIGEKWIAINGNANKLSRLVLEMDKEDKKILTAGETWTLGSGYELTINNIDAGTSPRQIRFTLKKDGSVIDEGSSYERKVYYKTQTMKGESDALLFAVFVERIFSGGTTNMAQFRYAWLTDANSAIEIQSFDTYDKFKVKEAGKDRIILENDGLVNLSRNTDIKILGGLALKVADSDNLRFYPYVNYTAPGSYEIRGRVFSSPEDGAIPVTWDAQSFAGFFYDIKNNLGTETLRIINQNLLQLNNNRTIDDKDLIYETGKAMVEFKVHEQEGLPVINNSEYYADRYPAVGWKAEKWIAINGNANKLSRLVLEMDTEDMKTLATGDIWSLGSGYELIINAIDAGTTPKQVWFSIKKDGAIIDEGISKEKNVYYKTQTIKDEADALLFAIYVESIFSGPVSDMVEFRYAWLTDADSAIEIQSADTYDIFMVHEASKDRILLENEGSVSLSKDTDVKLLGDIYFRIADSDDLRFYPKVDYMIAESTIPPHSLSILINHGDAYTNSTSVMLSLSAMSATEMSFSNDNVTWSPWEAYMTTRSWTLSESDGVKTVYFKVRNNDGEAAPVTDSIILDTIPPSVNIYSPANGTIVNTPNITIIGNAYDISGITAGSITHIFENGAGGRGWNENNSTSINFSHNIILHEGNNQIIIKYFDAANNSGSASVNLKLYTSRSTVSFEIPSVNMSVNSSRILNLTLNTAPTGLSGFNISISLSNGIVAQITDVRFPEWASLHNNSSLPSDTVWIKAADINRKIEAGSSNNILAIFEMRGEAAGITDVLINVQRMDDDNGTMIYPDTLLTHINVISIPALPGLSESPTDPDNDGLYEDMNGNGKKDFNDVVLFFDYIEWIAENEPLHNFDFNRNGRIDFNDIIRLFEEL